MPLWSLQWLYFDILCAIKLHFSHVVLWKLLINYNNNYRKVNTWTSKPFKMTWSYWSRMPIILTSRGHLSTRLPAQCASLSSADVLSSRESFRLSRKHCELLIQRSLKPHRGYIHCILTFAWVEVFEARTSVTLLSGYMHMYLYRLLGGGVCTQYLIIGILDDYCVRFIVVADMINQYCIWYLITSSPRFERNDHSKMGENNIIMEIFIQFWVVTIPACGILQSCWIVF